MVSPDDFKLVMRHWASTVTVVTTRIGDSVHGLTATAFSGLSADPAMVLVCVGKAAKSHKLIEEAGIFCVNFLPDELKDLSNRFAGRLSDQERYAGLEYGAKVTGAPVFSAAIAYLDCRLAEAYAGGDHTIFTGYVEGSGVQRPTDAPLVYWNGHYHKLGAEV